MIQTTDSERCLVLNNYHYFDEQELFYWHDKFTKRLKYLSPLLVELENKSMNLEEVCKPLAQEVFELIELLNLLNQKTTL
jgi:hypothetical protein